MQKVTWKTISVSDAGFKSSETPQTGVPEIGENDIYQTPETEVKNEIAGLFNGEANGETAEPSNPFAMTVGSEPLAPGTSVDPLTGETIEDPKASPYYVPSLDEIISNAGVQGISLRFKDYDQLVTLYKESGKKFKAEKAALEEKLESGEIINVGEIEYTKQLISLLDKSLAVTKTSLQKIPTLKEELKQNYIKEYIEFKKAAAPHVDEYNKGDWKVRSQIIKDYIATADITGDGWIGEPEMGIRIIQDTDQGTVLWDAESQKFISKLNADGSPVTQKWFDPTKTWTVSNEGLKVSEQSVGTEDLTLQIDGSTPSEKNNTFNSKIDIAVPDYVVVKMDKETSTPKSYFDKEEGRMRLYASEFTTNENGAITQQVPSDTEGYIQVRVAKVEIFSDDSNKDGKGYDHVMRFLTADGEIAAEFRITGRFGTGPASDYGGIAINGSQRTSPIVVDAKDLISTGAADISDDKLNKLYDEYDVDLDGLEDPNGSKNKAFKETEKVFTSSSGHVKENSEKATGLKSYGLSGYIEGSAHGNNLVFFADPSLTNSSAPREGKDEEENPLYNNVFIGNGNYNAVFANGGGNFYASDVTLAWRKNTKDTNALSAVAVKSSMDIAVEEDGDPNDSTDYETTPVSNFVYLGGFGDKMIDNPPDSDTTSKNVKMNSGDDYFNTEGEASYSNPKLNQDNAIGDPDADSTIGDDGAIDELSMKDIGDDIENALSDLDTEEVDPYQDLDITKLGGDYYDETYGEQEGFFAEISNMFGFKNEGMDEGEEASDAEEQKKDIKSTLGGL
ncbi:MAG: hypothetical protein HYT75_05565 [Deltaproteobacteria bacterium]|nr:hypothetical protein [Deltaproteobacteria bacterium]